MEGPGAVELDEATIERLARATHGRYRDVFEDGHLAALGFVIRPIRDGSRPHRMALDPDLVEAGGRREHRRWVEFMRAQGYVARLANFVPRDYFEMVGSYEQQTTRNLGRG